MLRYHLEVNEVINFIMDEYDAYLMDEFAVMKLDYNKVTFEEKEIVDAGVMESCGYHLEGMGLWRALAPQLLKAAEVTTILGLMEVTLPLRTVSMLRRTASMSLQNSVNLDKVARL